MSDVPLLADHARRTMIEAVRADGIDLDLDGVQVRAGWENVVLDTKDGWILRFPRDERVPFDRELQLLEILQDQLPAPIPRVAFVGRKTRFAAYRRLNGMKLDSAAFAAADQITRDRVAAGLARFLVAMHSAIDLAAIKGLQVPAFDADGLFPLDLDRLPAGLRGRYLEIHARVAESLAVSPHQSVLLHNDFHTGNLVLSGPLGRLAGVWDFSCVATGNPSMDFRYLVEDRELGARTASAYAARIGREVDLGLAADALRLEQVSDALEEGRDPARYLA